jgi:hypothetical protein
MIFSHEKRACLRILMRSKRFSRVETDLANLAAAGLDRSFSTPVAKWQQRDTVV